MTPRKTLDQMTSDDLDELHARIATLEHVAAGNKRHVQLIVPELERAEAAIARVRALYEQWVKTGPPPLGTPMSRWWDARLVELRDAILLPTERPKEQ
jgi:hypothetical protein